MAVVPITVTQLPYNAITLLTPTAGETDGHTLDPSGDVIVLGHNGGAVDCTFTAVGVADVNKIAQDKTLTVAAGGHCAMRLRKENFVARATGLITLDVSVETDIALFAFALQS